MADYIYAGLWRRLLAALIDCIIICITILIVKAITAVLPVAILLAAGEDAGNQFLKLTYDSIQFFDMISPIIITWLYSALFESLKTQATIGKLALRLKVTDLNGSRISFLRASLRYLGKILSALILFVGFIIIAFTKNKQGLHDMISGTYVIKNQG